MTRLEALALTIPFFAAVVMGLLFLLVTSYFDNRAAEQQKKQTQADDLHQMTDPAVSLSDLSEAEREQLKLHIESLEVFAKTVTKASAAVEESSRRVRFAAAARQIVESEHR